MRDTPVVMLQAEYQSEYGGRLAAGTVVMVAAGVAQQWARLGIAAPVPAANRAAIEAARMRARQEQLAKDEEERKRRMKYGLTLTLVGEGTSVFPATDRYLAGLPKPRSWATQRPSQGWARGYCWAWRGRNTSPRAEAMTYG